MEGVGYAHDDAVGPAAVVAGDEAQQGAYHAGDNDGADADEQGDARAVDAAREHVAAQAVRPSMCSGTPRSHQKGGMSFSTIFCLAGSQGESSGAKTEASTTIINIMKPIVPLGLEKSSPAHFLSQRPKRRMRLSPAGAVSTLSLFMLRPLSVSYPRVYDRVEHVGDEVRDDGYERNEHHAGLYDAHVAAVNALYQQLAEPGPGEDRLGYERAADEARHLQGDNRHDRNERVLEGVLIYDYALAQALAAGGADIVLL